MKQIPMLLPSEGCVAVVQERERQMRLHDGGEYFGDAHDDRYTSDQLVKAAEAYCVASCGRHNYAAHARWPRTWSMAWFKPTNRRRDLVKAAALIIAEIDRIDRLQT